jgi:hypothetical protein
MSLQSQLLRGDAKLEAAAVSDPAHILPGAVGGHVAKIQQVLIELDGAVIDPGELHDARYGPSTANAVLAYKQKRNIINRSYQTRPDNIVGKMTIASMDQEMRQREGPPSGYYVCTLDSPCPQEVLSVCKLRLGFALATGGVRGSAGPTAPPPATDPQVMQAAFQESRRTLGLAITTLSTLQGKLVMGNELLSDEEKQAFVAVVSWLKIDPPIVSREGKLKVARHIGTAINLMNQNLAVKTSKGQVPPFRRVSATYHAQTYGNPDRGVDCGEPFFTHDGPKCRRDVMTHEFFHFVGLHHGGGALQGPTIRMNIKTTAQALDSADNLAQLVAEITTPGGKVDACARLNE